MLEIMNSRDNLAFTLAEVLITLGIIGVVAAITIPTLIAKTHSKQYTTSFKKSLSTLSNAARMSEAQFGYDFAGIDTLCNANSGSDHPETKQTACALLNGTLKGAQYYYGLDKLGDYQIESKFFDDTWSLRNFKNALPIYRLPDGQLLILSSMIGEQGCENRSRITVNSDEEAHGTACYGLIDVNGISKPNREVTCAKGTLTYYVFDAKDCVVNDKTMGDIFPIAFYNNTVEPHSTAAWYVWRKK